MRFRAVLRRCWVGSIICGLSAVPVGCTNLVHDSDGDAVATGQASPIIDFKDPVLNQRKIVVTTEINELTGKEIIQKLFYLDSVGQGSIDLYLNTPGGLIEHGVAVIDVIQSLKSPVNTYAIGSCNSAGAMILVCGTGRRTAFPNSVIAIHGAVRFGKVPPDYFRIVEARVEAIWRKRAHLPEDWFPLKGEVEHFLTPERAMEFGVTDGIEHTRE